MIGWIGSRLTNAHTSQNNPIYVYEHIIEHLIIDFNSNQFSCNKSIGVFYAKFKTPLYRLFSISKDLGSTDNSEQCSMHFNGKLIISKDVQLCWSTRTRKHEQEKSTTSGNKRKHSW